MTTTRPVPVDPEAGQTAPATGVSARPEESAEVERLREALAVPARPSPALRWILPLVVLAVCLSIAGLLVWTRAAPEQRDPVVPVPLVRIQIAEPQDVRLSVFAQGTVLPRTESDLVAEVRGRVTQVSSSLVVGGFFSEGDVLLRLDDREHRIAVDRALALVKLRESESRLATSDVARRRQLASRGVASEADLEQFENRALVAEASLQEARAALAQARLDLERTVVRAPFDGRVRERNVDVGQFVSPGAKLGRVFAVDYAEVRLPIQTDELAYLDAEVARTRTGSGFGAARVVLKGRLGGQEMQWPARLVRAEAAIDEQTRMLHVVARVEDPYGLSGSAGGEAGSVARLAEGASEDLLGAGVDSQPGGEAIRNAVPLPSGLFVTAEIEGRKLEGVYSLPLMALRDGDRVFIEDDEGRLRVRDVSILRQDRTRVIVDEGLSPGDRIVISPLRVYSEGMAIRAVEASGS